MSMMIAPLTVQQAEIETFLRESFPGIEITSYRIEVLLHEAIVRIIQAVEGCSHEEVCGLTSQ